MEIFLPIFIISLVLSIIFVRLGYIKDLEIMINIGVCCTVLVAATGLVCLDLTTTKADNREYFMEKQQEYKVLTQYISSNKSDSILESKEMLEKIENYNKFIIEKQNATTRPIKKYWTEGANWNELKLIDLENR